MEPEVKSSKRFLEACVEAAQAIATEEGLTGENSIPRINELVNDAMQGEPKTDAGKSIRTKVLEAQASLKSPLSTGDVLRYDYNKHRDDTTNVGLAEAWSVIAKYPKTTILESPTPEYKKESEQAYQDCTLELFKLFNEKNVRMAEYNYLFASMRNVLEAMEMIMMDQVTGHFNEIKSNIVGVKNPGTNEYDHTFATYKNLIDLVDKLKEDKK